MNVSINSRDPAGRISGNLTQYRQDFSERKSMNSMVKVKGTPYEQGVMQGTEYPGGRQKDGIGSC